jgi:pyridoxamine 5'-phosphate oxidase
VDEDELARLRVEYDATGFGASDAGTDPMALFGAWFAIARAERAVPEANAVAFATAGADGTPSNRMVLLKAVDDARAAFAIYTNLESRKAREALGGSGRAALCWWWPGAPGRQVRAVGQVELVDRATAAAYFATRPREAQAGAISSHQSRVIGHRDELESRAAALSSGDLELPATWGGLRVVADELEFWQGRAGRLHDRISFLRCAPDGSIASSAAVDAAGGDAALRAAGTVVSDAHGARWLRVRLQP